MQTEHQYAGLNMRMIAATIDMGIIMIFCLPLIAMMSSALFGDINLEERMPQIPSAEALQAALTAAITETNMVPKLIFDNTMQLVFMAIVIIPCWILWGTTPGKFVLRMKIIDAETGGPLTPMQAVGRFLAYIVAMIPLGLGIMWMGFDSRKQGLHDKIANTLVIYKPKKIKTS